MNILIIRPMPLGNATYALPLLDALSRIPGRKNIYVLACALSATLFERHPAVTQILTLPKGKLNPKNTFLFARQLRSLNIDLAFLMKTGGTMERLALVAGIRHRIGFKKSLIQLLTHRYNFDENSHISEQSIQLLRYFPEIFDNLTPPDLRPKIHLDQTDMNQANDTLREHSLTAHKYITVHPMGSTIAASGLNHSLFASLVPFIARKVGCTPVFIGAPSEKVVLDELAGRTQGIAFTEKHSARETLQLISQARLHIGNDSGWSHVAEALGRPKIVLYPDNELNFKRWRPLALERSLALLNPSQAPQHEVERGVSSFLHSLNLQVE
jgi:ADP-heptose:LPS heptosyltransferase